MSYEVLERQIRALPEEALPEVESFVTYIQYKFGNKSDKNQAALERFSAMCKETQAWAKSVGMTEQDITDAIKEVRAANRVHIQA
ncbi:MAG: hypothetical protein K2I74_01200 [Treponemataceae bacterium]|nr:hypothetical protein [Treponemataceae bacterium]